MKKIIIAIDGHSSCGKSTMAKQLADQVGYIYVDTGAMYRAVAYWAILKGLLKDESVDEVALINTIKTVKIEFVPNPLGTQDVWINGENVEKYIRTSAVAKGASIISAIGIVRETLVAQQREMGTKKGFVLDGRDIGTVVFPEAELKIFLTATPEIRAERRLKELVEKGEKITFEEVLEDLKERDYRDENRDVDPLRPARDAIIIDNSHLTIQEQNELLMKYFMERVS